MSWRSLLVVLSLSTVTAVGPAAARPHRVAQIPNGGINRCATCHLSAAGGGPRNPFGTQIEGGFLDVPGAAGNVLWGAALASLDADDDGATNGRELEDPGGAWRPGQPQPGIAGAVTNPGVAAPRSVPAMDGAGRAALAALLLAAAVVSGARRRRRCSWSGEAG